MNFSLLRNLFEKINFNVGGRKNSDGNNIKINGNSNNIIDKIIHNNFYQKENNIELSEQAKRIYEEFKKSGYEKLSLCSDGYLAMVEDGKETLPIDNLNKRMVKADIDNLVKCGYLKFASEQNNIAVFYTLGK